MVVVGFIALFIILGLGALLLGFAAERAVVGQRISARKRTLLGVGSLLAYLILIVPVNLWVGCGEGCTVDPSSLIIYVPLQFVGWFAGRWLGKRFRQRSIRESDNANRSY